MTQVFREDGTVVPVTRIAAGPCVVTEVRKNEGVTSVQFGFGVQKVFRLNRPEQGHLKGIVHGGEGKTVRHLREVQIEGSAELKRGDTFTVSTFETGDRVKVTGSAKGKGFQGTVKRHGFKGGPASHGHKDNLRMPGSIGSTGPQRVLKGTRMAGHMGDHQVSVQNLEIVEVDASNNEILVKGAVPGARNSVVLITTKDGSIKIETAPEKTEAVPVAEAQAAETQPAEVVAEAIPATVETPVAEAEPALEQKEENQSV